MINGNKKSKKMDNKMEMSNALHSKIESMYKSINW